MKPYYERKEQKIYHGEGFSGGGTKGAGYRTEYVNGENKNKELPAQTFND